MAATSQQEMYVLMEIKTTTFEMVLCECGVYAHRGGMWKNEYRIHDVTNVTIFQYKL